MAAILARICGSEGAHQRESVINLHAIMRILVTHASEHLLHLFGRSHCANLDTLLYSFSCFDAVYPLLDTGVLSEVDLNHVSCSNPAEIGDIGEGVFVVNEPVCEHMTMNNNLAA